MEEYSKPYSKWRVALSYFKYWIKSYGPNRVHSPFIFSLFTEAIIPRSERTTFSSIDELRSSLIASKETISYVDPGDGQLKTRAISEIAASSAKNRKYGELLYRLANYLQPQRILELGTSLGISAAYQATGLERANHFITIEGVKELSNRSAEHMKSLNLDVECWDGDFNSRLDEALEKLGKVDWAFVDGHHQLDPTLDYFKKIKKFTHENSVIVFDDIHWSEGMENAWKKIKNDPDISLTVDLFFIGMVFFRKGVKKQDFCLRF